MLKKILTLSSIVAFTLLLMHCDTPVDQADLTPPGAPANLAYDANLSGDGQIYLTWEAPGDEDVSAYTIYRASGNSDFQEVTTVDVTNYLDTNLDYTIEYSYKVTAEDDSGNESPFSNTVSLMPVNLLSPATPANLVIKAHNIPAEYRTNVELTWTGNQENDFAYYRIYRSSEAALFIPDSISEIDSLTDVFYYDENVTPGTTYYYKLIAFDKGDKASDPTNVVSDTPLEEPALIAPIGNATISSTLPTFRWTNVDHAVKYKLIVRTSALTGDIWESEINATTDTEMTLSYPQSAPALNANTSYFWFVSGYSQDSDEINTYTAADAFRTP